MPADVSGCGLSIAKAGGTAGAAHIRCNGVAAAVAAGCNRFAFCMQRVQYFVGLVARVAAAAASFFPSATFAMLCHSSLQ